jgi:hypothetical protein
MPIATVIAPPTLAVRQAPTQNSSVVQLAIPTVNYSLGMSTFDDRGGYWQSSELDLQRVATSIAMQGQPFALKAPSTNSSYVQHIFAPQLKCGPANDTIAKAALQTFTLDNTYGEYPPLYAAWTPYDEGSPINITEFFLIETSEETDSSEVHQYATVDEWSSTAAQIYVATFIADRQPDLIAYECSLYNTSYTIEFAFTDGLGSFEVQDESIMNPVNFSAARVMSDYVTASYISMLDAIGKIMIGVVRGTVSTHSGFTTSGATILTTVLSTCEDFPQPASSHLSLGLQSNKTLDIAVSDLMMNLTLSLLTQPEYL